MDVRQHPGGRSPQRGLALPAGMGRRLPGHLRVGGGGLALLDVCIEVRTRIADRCADVLIYLLHVSGQCALHLRRLYGDSFIGHLDSSYGVKKMKYMLL